MTSMIDVVFLLLAFFVITFTVVREGDFDIESAVAGGGGTWGRLRFSGARCFGSGRHRRVDGRCVSWDSPR